MCLRTINSRESITPSELARQVSLSQATVTGIVDRLAARQLVTRERNEEDRRLVKVCVSEAGKALALSAPSPLQERFAIRLKELSVEERATITEVLNRIVNMMDGEEIEVAPVLSIAAAADPDTESVDLASLRTTELPIPGGASGVPDNGED